MRPEDQRSGTARYTVVPRTLIFLTHDDQILLLQGADDKPLWARKWNGIGGHMEPGESPYQSALRELYEETGLVPQTLELRAIVHITMPAPPGIMLFVLVGKGAGEPKVSSEGEAAWIDMSRMYELPLVEDLPELLPRILTSGPVCSAHYTITDAGLHITFD